jgi:hypothetical protein
LRSHSTFTIAQRNLTLPGEIHRLTEYPGRLLRRVKAGGVFRLDEVEIELRVALKILRRG